MQNIIIKQLANKYSSQGRLKEYMTCNFYFPALDEFSWDFPGGPVVKTPRFHCRGRGFDPWSGN